MAAVAELARQAFLSGLIGAPWRADARGPEAFDCWHLAQHVEQTLFARALPDIVVPPDVDWAWIIDAMRAHPERRNWEEVDAISLAHARRSSALSVFVSQTVHAPDGALVLLARAHGEAHCGVWLVPEQRVIHCEATCGVVWESFAELRDSGWRRLFFYLPREVIGGNADC